MKFVTDFAEIAAYGVMSTPGLVVNEKVVSTGKVLTADKVLAIAQAVGAPVFDFIKQVNAELAACDTETCRWQLRTATGANVVHPIWLIHKA